MKLWDKGTRTNLQIERFTVGKDQELDLHFAEFDVLGSIAHIKMLVKIGILTNDEHQSLKNELIKIYHEFKHSNISIDSEDIHSQIENMLTSRLGTIGKKIHSGRSRNDQVLLDLHLFSREKLIHIITKVDSLCSQLLKLSKQYKNILLPGYTHFQIAMPSSFGLWFSAFAESLTDDMELLHSAYKCVNHNPLGTAAGYGTSIPLDRKYTTELLGFEDLLYNSMYAQISRTKTEKTVSFALASVATTISKMSSDICTYMCQNMGFISLPDSFTTGSSIMPHKKNPDIFELVRGRCNKIQSIPFQISQIGANLTSGYFRDFQILKETYIPIFDELLEVLEIFSHAIKNLIIKDNILDDPIYDSIFSVESVNNLVLNGTPFREAYQLVGKEIMNKNYKPAKMIKHTHEGSINNLCLDEIQNKMKSIIKQFDFVKVKKAYKNLLDIKS